MVPLEAQVVPYKLPDELLMILQPVVFSFFL
jgi:hypothetical protein